VARYYFDFYQGVELVPDKEGTDLDSVDAAMQIATHSAAEIGTGQLVKGDVSDVVIEVRDEHHQRVFTVTASMRIDWHDLLPQPSHPGNP
jgi:hypothetical protein